jgi:hypothetical protein
MTHGPNRSTRVFLWLFVLIGLGAIGAGAWNLFQSLRCTRWPVTEGVITNAKMTRSSSGKGGDTYGASIAYDYKVAGTFHTSTRLAFGAMSSSRARAQAILDRYPVGKQVAVHYAPTYPEEAVLETGVHGGTWICFAVGTVFVLAGAMFLGVFSAANRAGPVAPATTPDASRMQPPLLMGVIFALMGAFVFFMEPSTGTPRWIVCAGGGVFVLAGLYLLALRLQNKLYSKILLWGSVLCLLALFHWVSFAPGQRIGTSTGTFSHQATVRVDPWFAAFTVFFDVVLLAAGARWLVKGRRG